MEGLHIRHLYKYSLRIREFIYLFKSSSLFEAPEGIINPVSAASASWE